MGIRNTSAVRKDRKRGRLLIDFRYVDNDGRPRRYCRDATVQTMSAARAEAARLKEQVAEHGQLARRDAAPTFAAFVSGDFERLFMPRFRPATRVRYAALFRQSVLSNVGRVHLDEIGAAHVRAYAAELTAAGVQTKGPITLVRTVLRAAVEVGVIDAMPLLPPLAKQSRKLPDAPTPDELATVLRCSEGWLRVAIALGAYAGLRSGEVRALEVRDVDLATSTMYVRHALSEDTTTTPKSGHERIVPLAPELADLLASATRTKLPRARVVLTESGETPTRQLLLHRFRRLQARCGLHPRSFHALRHFFCSQLVRRGAGVEAVRLLAGHAGLTTTQRYVHATATDLRAAIAKLVAD